MNHLDLSNRPSLKIPRENNRGLCWPSVSDVPRLLKNNRHLLTDGTPQWFSDLRALARHELSELASKSLPNSNGEWTGLRDIALIVSGHQPELYHPGVWFKNFLIHNLAIRSNAASINVIIDHDAVRENRLRVPSFENGSLFFHSIEMPFLRPEDIGRPWHTIATSVVDQSGMAHSIQRAVSFLESCGVRHPIIESHKQLLFTAIHQSSNVAEAFSYFRHQIEIENGLRNYEVSLNAFCTRQSFELFFRRCIVDSETLWQVYNQCCREYRQRKRIRNVVQPVPDLQRVENFVELPFWIYSTGSSHSLERRSVWITKLNQEKVVLSDHFDPRIQTMEVPLFLNDEQGGDLWKQLMQQGLCIRPKALMTTLFLRCFVADLFVHGIGGGVYDEVTDAIIYHWLGITPPTYLVASASLHLPIRIPDQKDYPQFESEMQIRNDLHRLRSAPESYLDQTVDFERGLKEHHTQLLANMPARGHKKIWHRKISQLKVQIQDTLAEKYRSLRSKLAESAYFRQQQGIRNSREYSFALFQNEDIVPRMRQLVEDLNMSQ